MPYDPPELELKATYGLVSPEQFPVPDHHPLWTAATYAAFDLSKAFPNETANSVTISSFICLFK